MAGNFECLSTFDEPFESLLVADMNGRVSRIDGYAGRFPVGIVERQRRALKTPGRACIVHASAIVMKKVQGAWQRIL